MPKFDCQKSSPSYLCRTVKFRLYPTVSQENSLSLYIESSRKVYNRAIEHRTYAQRPEGKSISYFDQQRQLTLQRKIDIGMSQIPVDVQRDGLRRADSGFNAFFRRCREGEKKKGFPRFKSKSQYNSFTLANPAEFFRNGGLRVDKIAKPIRVRGMPEITGKQKRLTIVRKSGKWYGRILVDIGVGAPQKRDIKTSVGIDMGLNSFLATSDGEHIQCPKEYRRLEPKLKRAQKLASRRKRGSNRHKKAQLVVQRIHQKIANRRDDFTHKLSKQLVEKYDLIAAEKLNICGMVRSKLAKSIFDASWGEFLCRVGYKAESAGATFVQGNPRRTSIDCSGSSNGP